MPSTTPKMAHTMAGAAHNADFAKKVGIPMSVAKEFNKADVKTGILRKKRKRQTGGNTAALTSDVGGR